MFAYISELFRYYVLCSFRTNMQGHRAWHLHTEQAYWYSLSLKTGY